MCTPATPRFLSLSALLCASALVIGLAGLPGEEGDVDLAALAMVGPGQVHVGTSVAVTINVANFGEDPHSTFTAEVVLSSDTTVDASDVIVGTVTHDFLGYQSLMVAVPTHLPAGAYYWGFRVLPAGETDPPANNQTIGTAVHVIATDLTLDDPSDIEFSWVPVVAEVPEAEVVVSNSGSIGSILVFTADTLSPAPWLHIDTPSNFAIAGEDGNTVTLRPIVDGLPVGVYEATVRFMNTLDLDDFEQIDVRLTVDPIVFNPGDSLVGDIANPGDEDRMFVDVVKGEKIVLKGRSNSGDLILRVNFLDPDGAFESKVVFPHNEVFTKKTIKLKRSGRYTMVVDGKGDTFGAYQIKSNRKLPKKARPRVLTVGRPSDGGPADVTVLTLAGAILDFGIEPNKKFWGPVSVECVNPGGAVVDIDDHEIIDADGLKVEDLVVDELGAHIIRIHGFGDHPKARVELSIYPVQPDKGTKKIYLP